MRRYNIVLLALCVAIVVGEVLFFQTRESPAEINSFTECEKAGYPIGESEPRQCWTPEGKHFTEIVDEKAIIKSYGVVKGNVLLGPTCPVVSDPPDPLCADRPYATSLVLTTADGARVLKTFSSDSGGNFYVETSLGKYMIRSAAAGNILPYCQSQPFTVSANGHAEVVVPCDTGIR